MPGPAPRTFVVTVEHLEVVRKHLSSRRTERRVADRCRVLLLRHNGLGPTEIAQRIGWVPPSVCRLVNRYVDDGISVVQDKPRPGRPRSFSPSTTRKTCLTGVRAPRR